jgi:hypothetical protein
MEDPTEIEQYNEALALANTLDINELHKLLASAFVMLNNEWGYRSVEDNLRFLRQGIKNNS